MIADCAAIQNDGSTRSPIAPQSIAAEGVDLLPLPATDATLAALPIDHGVPRAALPGGHVDGREPNSYAGIFWILGRYDRSWGPQRAVFGSVRFMSSAATLRKLELRGYLREHGAQAARSAQRPAGKRAARRPGGAARPAITPRVGTE